MILLHTDDVTDDATPAPIDVTPAPMDVTPAPMDVTPAPMDAATPAPAADGGLEISAANTSDAYSLPTFVDADRLVPAKV